jgi:hypothetical protein
MAELSKLQQAMAYQALYKALGPVVEANGDGLRGEVDRELRDIYEKTGAKTYKVQADGVQLGTYSITESKAVPEHEEVAYDLVDDAALSEWVRANPDVVTDYIVAQGEPFAAWCVAELGEVPGGVEAHRVTVPARPASYKGGAIRVDKAFQAEVARRMDAGLAALVAPAEALLEDGS